MLTGPQMERFLAWLVALIVGVGAIGGYLWNEAQKRKAALLPPGKNPATKASNTKSARDQVIDAASGAALAWLSGASKTKSQAALASADSDMVAV